MVVDYLIKKNHYIPYTIEENNITIETTAQLLFQNIWKLHGFLSLLTSDKNPQFILRFEKNVCKILGISTNLSTCFYPKTNE